MMAAPQIETPTEDLEIAIEPETYAYPDTASHDEQRRAFIAAHYLPNSAEIAGEVLVANLALIETWLRSGVAAPRLTRPALRPVKP